MLIYLRLLQGRLIIGLNLCKVRKGPYITHVVFELQVLTSEKQYQSVRLTTWYGTEKTLFTEAVVVNLNNLYASYTLTFVQVYLVFYSKLFLLPTESSSFGNRKRGWQNTYIWFIQAWSTH